MGYYTGSGVVTSGGQSVSVLESFVFYGAHNVYQKDTATATTKAGVQLSTAQAATADCAMNTHQFTWGSCYHWTPNAYGTKSEVAYSRIGDSNLYTLTTTAHSISAKLDSGSWVNP